jgi:predicted kinase
VEYTHDIDLLKLIRFYKCYRAYVRGKVESFKGQDKNLSPTQREEVLERARKHFELSDTYANPKPYLVITSGLTGTGKSKLADALARDLDMELFQSDRIRKEIAGLSLSEHRFVPFGRDIYNPEMSRKTYETLASRAQEALSQGRPVILDATYLRMEERKEIQNLADQTGIPFFIVEVMCSEEEVKKRLFDRLRQVGGLSDGRWEIYLSQKKIQDPVTGIPTDRHFVIDTNSKEDLLFEIEKKILIEVETEI